MERGNITLDLCGWLWADLVVGSDSELRLADLIVCLSVRNSLHRPLIPTDRPQIEELAAPLVKVENKSLNGSTYTHMAPTAMVRHEATYKHQKETERVSS